MFVVLERVVNYKNTICEFVDANDSGKPCKLFPNKKDAEEYANKANLNWLKEQGGLEGWFYDIEDFLKDYPSVQHLIDEEGNFDHDLTDDEIRLILSQIEEPLFFVYEVE